MKNHEDKKETEIINQIAKSILGIKTLEPQRNSTELFNDL
jgi:hypothetical protein